MLLRIPKGWELPEALAIPESLLLSRRKFLNIIGLSTISYAALEQRLTGAESSSYPARRNNKYTLNQPLTPETVASRYNNFREFSHQKEAVWLLTDQFQIQPWTLQVAGLVRKPQTFDLEQLIRRMPLEERLYRHRCVEGWSMAVPWTGFPFKALVDLVQPTSDARYVLMNSFLRPDQAEGQRINPGYPWPQRGALTLPEARNELAFLVTGMYGHDLPKSNGAPIRLAVPWKYGFKSIKSIVAIEFTAQQPQVVWAESGTGPHSFSANVNPADSSPRFSQAREKVIGTWEVRPTLPYNGYGPSVAHLYQKA